MANLFSDPEYLRAAAATLFPGQAARPGTVEVAGRRYDVLLQPDGGVAHLPLADFYEERDGNRPPLSEPVTIGGLPAISHGLRPADGTPVAAGRRPAPTILWSELPSWAAFVEQARAREWRTFHRTDRKLRKLSRELGKARFALDLRDHELLDSMLLWNSRQLRRTRRFDRFTSPRVRQLVHLLVERGSHSLAALYAGDEPVAVVLSSLQEGRLSCLMTAYDPRCARVSPGILLFEWLMEQSFERGDRELDFLVGDEAYKLHYATHLREVGPTGSQPQRWRLRVATRRAITHASGRGQWVRKRGYDAAHALLERESLAPLSDPPPAWEARVRADTADWPRARLVDPAKCQLQALVSQAAAERSVARDLGLRAADAGRHLRWRVVGKVRRTLKPPVVLPPLPRPEQPLRAGELVRVRDDLPARMVGAGGMRLPAGAAQAHAGRTYRVHKVVERFYDERQEKVLRASGGVLLEGVACDGRHLDASHGCDRGCLLFFSDRWLDRVDPAEARPAQAAAPAAARRARVRSQAEIEASIAAGEGPAGVPFVPELMAHLCGQVVTIQGPLRRAYDERRGTFFDVDGAVVLAEARCSGVALTGGGRCDRGCALFLREAWLAPA